MTTSQVRRRYVDVAWGQIHLREAGFGHGGVPLVLLHQTPRSGDEFAEVLDRLGPTRWVMAPDLPGMGASDAAPGGHTIESYAAGIVDAVVALGVPSIHLLGHHTGAVVAVEIAARAPELVVSLILSSCPWVDADGRERRQHRPPIDEVERRDDGAHLQELWQRRQQYYPAGRPDLLQRFVGDAIAAGDPEAGHRAVAKYEMEHRGPNIRCAILQLVHRADPFAAPEADTIEQQLRPTERVDIVDGGIPLEFAADEVAHAVDAFLSRHAV